MRKILLAWHNFFFELNDLKKYKEKNRILWAICGINWKMASHLLFLYMRFYGFCGWMPKKNLDPTSNVVVSLTSFPARISIVWMIIDSLFHQKVLPSKICLYLSEEEFPDGHKSLPKRLLKYEKKGLEICFRENNLMPHNKYYYALQEHKESLVVTIDDDIYCNDNTISNLLKIHHKYPNAVCSNSCHVIRFDKEGNILPYDLWIQRASRQEASHLNVALGYNGVLYPPIDYGKMMFDINKIKELSLKADDLWLKAIEIKQNIKVVNGDYFCRGVEFGNSQVVSLSKTNVNSGQNDVQWNKLCKEFSITKESFNS